MLRFLPLLLLFVACSSDPLKLDVVNISAEAASDGLTEIPYTVEGPVRDQVELLSSHEDLTLRLSYRAEAESSATLTLQGKYPIALPSLDVAGATKRMTPETGIGYWHDLELQFKAPTATTPALLVALYLDGNLIYYQQELPASTAPAGPLTLAVQSGGVELANLRQGSVAGRSSSVDPDGNVVLNMPLLRYDYYELPQNTKDVSNWAQLTPTASGYIHRLDLNNIRKVNNYAARFFGTLEIPEAGTYTFRIFSSTLARMYIDGNLVIDNPGTHNQRETTAPVTLSAGPHDVRLEYIQTGGWNAFDVTYQFKDQPEGILNSMSGDKAIATPAASEPLVVETDDEPYLLRSFLYFPAPRMYEEATKRTHVISVGEGTGPHYSLDLQTGALLQVWRGGFADAYDMWADRGEPQVMRPLGAALAFDGSPQWAASATDAWPAEPLPSEEDDFSLSAYELDSLGRPTFHFTYGPGSVSDKLQPTGQGLLRELTFMAGGTPHTFTQLAAARSIKEIAPGEYELQGPGLRLKIESYDGSGLTLQRSAGKDRLIAHMRAKGHIRYRMDW
ncbi:PA14 domain-containing protein [Neolewinella lacunae]|uniref:PA14 domain-containing protein n=1 Tax=Neolewinella lacunae TaxID=1517758 RepID=A0A923PNC1_9BACT|nr:PA14 domain-containing protein [Neolewinella lacunae]MBC6993682.1 hypothetical protein [Neolewinella lacunae]MDN3636377.1 PA14 domain-containing protein [Neolewinella lacunae]